MNGDPNISDFDKWVKESLQNASTPPPPGMWEGISAAGTGAGSGAGIASQLKEFILQTLGWKAGIGAAVIITTASLIYYSQENKAEKTTVENTDIVEHTETPVQDSNGLPREEKINDVDYAQDRTAGLSQQEENQPTTDELPSYQLEEPSGTTEKTALPSPGFNQSQPKAADVPIHQRHGGTNQPSAETAPPAFKIVYEVNRKCDESIFELRLDNGEKAEWFLYTGKKWIKGQPDRFFIFSLRESVDGNNEVIVKAVSTGTEATTTLSYEPISTFEWKELHNKQMLFSITGEQPEIAIWDFGDGSGPKLSQHSEIGHFYNYRKEPYPVSLIARYADGCIDTIQRMVQVPFSEEQYEPFIPNIFTPYSKDGKNDVFSIDIESPTYYHLIIKNVLGKVVFESRDPSQSWNGRIQNKGELCPQGKYVYALTYSVGNHPLEVKQNILYLR